MNKRLIIAFTALAALAALVAWLVLNPKEAADSGDGADCGEAIQTFTMQDEWMPGVLDKGAEFTAVMDWQKCGAIEAGDLVLYQISKSHDPVVRRVAGAPGDTFKLIKAANNNSWNIEINGRLLMSGDKPYHFGSANPPALKLYQDTRQGVLDQTSVLLFSIKPPGDQDSGLLGVLSIKDIIGVVRTAPAR